jgi:two-component system OmpR family sensor kinase
VSDSRDLAVLLHELRAPVAALARLAEAAAAAPDRASLEPLLTLAVAAGRDVERILGDPTPRAGRLVTTHLAPLVAGATVDGGGRVELLQAADPLVVADPTRLRQALANLVANALRHGTTVSVTVSVDAGRAIVEVSDDGAGVAEELDPFARGTSAAGSTGLGLWLARAIAEEHGGTLELVGPGPDGGACFRLALPCASGDG